MILGLVSGLTSIVIVNRAIDGRGDEVIQSLELRFSAFFDFVSLHKRLFWTHSGFKLDGSPKSFSILDMKIHNRTIISKTRKEETSTKIALSCDER